jgi:hypothetical protein
MSMEQQARPADLLLCLLCGWRGYVPERPTWAGIDRRRWPRH